MFQSLDTKIQELANESDARKSLDIAIETANEILRILNPDTDNLRVGEDALDDAIPVNQFPNQKAESWFANHPYFTGDKVALRFYSSDTVETKFYWLSDSATKARVSAGVMLTPNWEDSKLTRNDSYKIGVDFFLTSKAKSLLVVISNNGNLRLLEFSEKLSHTQIEILQKLSGSLILATKEQIHKTLWDALALSEVNKKFYAGVAEQFNILLNHLIADGRDKEDSKLFASRLLGRLLFIWFLRRKNIIQEQFGYFELEGNDATTYYNLKLKKLFFATLNMPVGERQGEDDKTPYLNGGLFEAHDNDWAHQTVNFPTGFFNGLYEHLEKYNFTTDESSPEYEQVAIDPEMLGRVFESLLATQVTETGDQARKAKGTFYTPREIVSYMCKESLRQYLYAKLDNEAWNDGIDSLLNVSDSEWEINHSNSKRNLWGESNLNTVPRLVIAALDDLTVLDPACGSGAFPMGMLQLILKTYERLDPRFDPYKTKLQIIQNNIFGVDIEPMAVEISRLRAWLSLVVDDEDEHHRVEPLPNLDFKFVSANSLLLLEKQTGIFADANLHEKLAELRSKFFNARKPEMKEKWKNEYYKLTGRGQITFGGDRRDQQLKSFDPFKNSRPADFFDPEQMFGIEEGFSIVIGNPPYVSTEKISEPEKSQYKDLYADVHASRIDLYVYFIERGMALLRKDTGVLSFITSNKWMLVTYGRFIRAELANKDVLQIVDFGSSHVFDGVTVDTNILMLRDRKVDNLSFPYVNFSDEYDPSVSIDTYFKENSSQQGKLSTEPWVLEGQDVQILKKKIESEGLALEKWDIQLNYGIKTGCNEAFIVSSDVRNQLINADPASADIIKPILRGRDIKRFSHNFSELYLLAVGFGDYKDLEIRYPAVYNHLFHYKEVLEARGQCRSSRSGKQSNPDYPGQHHWLELDNNPSQDYLKLIDGEKIAWGNLALHTQFSLVPKGYAISAPGNFIVSDKNDYLLGVLNSKLSEYYIKLLGITRNGGYFEFQPRLVKKLPVPIPSIENKEIISEIENYTSQLRANLNDNIAAGRLNKAIYALYDLSPEQIDIIEMAIK